MKYNVYVISDAEEDVLDIYRYVSLHDTEEKAKYLLDKIEKTCQSLEEYPKKGHVPPELERIGVYNYREVHFKPYRIIYEIGENEVFIHCVLDGRRSLQELLERRLLR
ncbi:MAG TPA: type II toxin-antitoxin system RelE/ParE family toxin [Candidatus Aminicenantes bacterium]|nr:type II toxin-antitoxin system RelE/ParE family toxin [Candidatus Aminicenantes bacterium]